MLTADDLKKLYGFNLKDVPEDPITKDYFFIKLKELTGLDDQTPFFIYLYNGKIDNLESLYHDQESIEYYNLKSLHIFLYEPLCYKAFNSQRHNQGFYSEFNSNDRLFIADEFESISKYVTQNNLKNVIVHTGDYNCEKYFSNYNLFKIVCDDLFLKNQNFTYETINVTNFNYEKKFICLNWRYTKHRCFVSSYLEDNDCYLSWYYRSTLDDLKENLWFDLDLWKTTQPDFYSKIAEGLSNLNSKVPLCLDIIHDGATVYSDVNGSKNYFPNNDFVSPSIKNVNENSLIDFYKNSFCEIVTESRFAQPTGNFSEKVFKPIHYKKPFILVAPPYTLEYVRSFGFKTFSDYFDESYDLEINHENRLLKIFKLIDYVRNLSSQEIVAINENLKEILEYNFDLLHLKIKNGWKK